jgi:hypothetical protein
MTLSCIVLYRMISQLKVDTGNSQVKPFLFFAILFGPIYVIYMILVDIPMYYNRWLGDEQRGAHYHTFLEGVKDATACKIVTQDYEMWKGDLSWITGYFSFAVWVSIWLIRSPRLPSKAKTQ